MRLLSRAAQDRRGGQKRRQCAPIDQRSAITRAGRAALILGTALALAACAAQRSTPGPTASAPPPAIVTQTPVPAAGGEVAPGEVAQVALLLPLRADGEDPRRLARSLANAAQLAVRDLPTRTLQIKTYDTRGAEDGAAEAARQAIADGADVIVGPVFSQAVSAAKPIAAEAGVTMLSFSNDASVAGGNVFLLGFLIGDEVERVTRYAVDQGLVRLAAIAPQTRLGEVSLDAFDRAARSSGAQIVAVERYPLDFQGIETAARRYADISEAQIEPAQALLIADRGQSLQAMAAFLTFFNVAPDQTKFFGSGLWRTDTTLREVSLQGGWFAAPDPRVTEQFDARYASAFGEAPHQLGSLGFDAIAVAGALASDARASQNSFPFSPDLVASPGGFIGVNGVFRFREDGLNERALAVLEVRPDGFAVIDPAPQSFVGN